MLLRPAKDAADAFDQALWSYVERADRPAPDRRCGFPQPGTPEEEALIASIETGLVDLQRAGVVRSASDCAVCARWAVGAVAALLISAPTGDSIRRTEAYGDLRNALVAHLEGS